MIASLFGSFTVCIEETLKLFGARMKAFKAVPGSFIYYRLQSEVKCERGERLPGESLEGNLNGDENADGGTKQKQI